MDRLYDYEKKKIDFSAGYIFKGKDYRCSFVSFDSQYPKAPKGTEKVTLYNYMPKGTPKGSCLILHGLGSSNVKFILWLGPHLAAAGINATVLILPGNFTRVEDGSVSGSSFLYPQVNHITPFWEQSLIDVQTTIDFLEQNNLWSPNNCLMGYCLGGMLGTAAAALDPRINQKIFMTASGHYPMIIHESKAASFARRLIDKGVTCEYGLHDKDYIYNLYANEMPKIKEMTLDELLTSESINPIFKIEPMAFCHLIDPETVSVIDALFDGTLPIDSRKMFYKALSGCKKHIVPISHVSWLPFEFLLARYILHKLNIHDANATKSLMTHEKYEDPLDLLSFIGSASIGGIKKIFK